MAHLSRPVPRRLDALQQGARVRSFLGNVNYLTGIGVDDHSNGVTDRFVIAMSGSAN
jgi:hypothetical protein